MPWPPRLGIDSFVLGFGICGLTASALWRIPLGAMTSVTFLPGGQIDAYWPGVRERLFIVRAGFLSSPSPPFLTLPITLPLLSRPLEVGPYSSPFLPSIPFPSHVNHQCQKP